VWGQLLVVCVAVGIAGNFNWFFLSRCWYISRNLQACGHKNEMLLEMISDFSCLVLVQKLNHVSFSVSAFFSLSFPIRPLLFVSPCRERSIFPENIKSKQRKPIEILNSSTIQKRQRDVQFQLKKETIHCINFEDAELLITLMNLRDVLIQSAFYGSVSKHHGKGSNINQVTPATPDWTCKIQSSGQKLRMRKS
uniref:Uncharacterized protein LOC104224410 n=1 Tax=Nicotiana sylvestris TaxID=4096 RepID=A0A1U7WAT8_NICSY